MIVEGKSVQLLLTARLSVKQWDLWEGGLGIRGRCHRLLWITFMKASPPPSLSLIHPRIYCPSSAAAGHSPLNRDPRFRQNRRLLPWLRRRGAASLGNSAEVCLHFPRISGIIREIK